MFLLWPLQTVLDSHGDGEVFEGPVTNKTITYEHAGECTKSLKRFLKKLEVLQQLSLVIGKEGMFRIPQLKSFLYKASRTLSDKDISRISIVVKGHKEFKGALQRLDRLDNELSRLCKLQKSSQSLNTITATSTRTSESLSPILQEFVRFIEVSAGLRDNLRPDELSYQDQVVYDPETFSCFREDNETYRSLMSFLKVESCLEEPLFLARWIMWRLFAWGLPELQNAFGNSISSGQDVVRRRAEVAKANANAAVVKMYEARICPPEDLNSIQRIWTHGVRLWENWRKKSLPLSFRDVQLAIQAGRVPIYSTGRSAQLLLFGDIFRLGIMAAPTEGQMAKLLMQADSRALDGLNILGFAHESEDEVEDAFCFLRDALNRHLNKETKLWFHKSEVSVFDLEWALCKVVKKQSEKITRSPIWTLNSTVSKKRKRSGTTRNRDQPPKRQKIGRKK